jgi:hypothetical protein
VITADTLKTLTTLTPTGLSQVLKHSGYTGCFFKRAEFLGLTNGGEFCYKVTYYDDSGEGEEVGKVFVKYDTPTGMMTADY